MPLLREGAQSSCFGIGNGFERVAASDRRAGGQPRARKIEWYKQVMLTLSHLSDRELLACLPDARAAERTASATMIAYLAEVDRRRLFLAEAGDHRASGCWR
jgi:hypothetical protein